MSRTSIRRGRRSHRIRIAVVGLVIETLVTGCGTRGPRPIPAETAAPAERDACEALSRRAESRVQGGSTGGGAAMGAAFGTLVGLHGVARSDGHDKNGGAIIGALVGGLGVLGGLVGAAVVVVRTAGVRRAAYAETMDVCLRPALLGRQLGPEHPAVASSLHALAFRYLRHDEFEKAEPLLARALAVWERSLGADAPEVAAILEDYAVVLTRTGRVAEGEALARRAREIRSRRGSDSARARGRVPTN